MTGWMAASLAGHDKNKIYIIIEETDEYVWLVDGELRKLENPKRKRKKHIQVIKKSMDENLAVMLQSRETDSSNREIKSVRVDEAIKRSIKLYKQSLTQHK